MTTLASCTTSSDVQVTDVDSEAKEVMKPSYYYVDGNKVESHDEFLKHAETRAAQGSKFVDIEDEEKVKAVTKKLVELYGGANERLKPAAMSGLVNSLVVEFGLHPRDFPNVRDMFWRFDFSGDGALEEDEVLQLVVSMLRHHRDRVKKDKAKQQFINLPRKQLNKCYTLGRKLGQGGQGAVYLAEEVGTQKSRVVKFFNKGDLNAPLDDIKDEFNMLTRLDHPQIQRLYDIFEDTKYVYLISEPYLGGDLTDLVPRATSKGVNVTIRWLGRVAQQVVQGVCYLHSKHIMHCDLKEANAVIATTDLVDPSVVVIDFGLADKFVGDGAGVSGTPGYMPPEVWKNGLWTPKGDIHALGVMLYQMFSGEKCYPANTLEECRNRTCNTEPYLLPLQKYPHLDILVGSMLEKRFGDRPSATKILASEFFACVNDTGEINIQPEVIAALSKLQKTSDCQAAILCTIASSQNLAQFQTLNRAFMALDRNNDGCINAQEAEEKLKEVFPEELVQTVVSTLVGDSGQVMYTRFMGQLILAISADITGLLWREFTTLDTDENGSLSPSEVVELVGRPALASLVDDLGVEDVIKMMDIDANGNITWEEFQKSLLPQELHNEALDISVTNGRSTMTVNVLTTDTVASAKEKIKTQGKTTNFIGDEPFDLVMNGATLNENVALAGCKLNSSSTFEVRFGAGKVGNPTVNSDANETDIANAKGTKVVWSDDSLVHMSSTRAMHEHSMSHLRDQCLAMTLCCSWPIPVFFLAAANVHEDCETTVGLWLILTSCMFVIGTPLVHFFIFLFARANVKVCFQYASKLLYITPFLNISLGSLGFYYYFADSDDRCVDEDGINPRTLALVWGIISGLAVCSAKCAVGCLHLNASEPQVSPE